MKNKYGQELTTDALTEQDKGHCAQAPGSAPVWYTEREMYHWLILREYAPSIAKELAGDYARHLQAAFDKGFEIGKRQAQNRPSSRTVAPTTMISRPATKLAPRKDAPATGPRKRLLRGAPGWALWKCTGCGVTGTWKSWRSSCEPGTHQCDVCALDGKKAKLISTAPNKQAQTPPP